MRIVLACLVMVGLALPDQEAAAFNVIGAGLSSCGTWTANRHYPDSVAAIMGEQWVLGFLTGIAYMGPDSFDPLEGLDLNAVDGWIDNYCRANPLARILDAAKAFSRAHPR